MGKKFTKRSIMIAVIASILVVSVIGVSAYLRFVTLEKSNDFTTGDVKVELVGNNSTLDKDTNTIKVEPAVKNVGSTDIYVRMIPVVSDESILGDDSISVDENWIWNGDGYYYYTKVLKPNETTETLFKDITLKGTSSTDLSIDFYCEGVCVENYSDYMTAFEVYDGIVK